MRRLLVTLLALYTTGDGTLAAAAAERDQGESPYVGSSRCEDCHADASRRWAESHHALAWTEPGPDTVLGDFDDARFEHAGVTTRFARRGEDYFITTDGPDGAMTGFRVAGVAGVSPLQQYVLETEPGRLQSFDVVWDVEAERWYHLYPDQDLPAGDGFHWTGPYKTWNARCAECHATGYVRGYDAARRRYDSGRAEIGVGCEACHGPGADHVAWAAHPGAPGAAPERFGFSADLSTAAGEIDQCGGCHARREPLLDGSPVPGTPFLDAYRPSLLLEGVYHADGQILDEVYVHGSFAQSRMAAMGVRCSDCHDPHGARLRAEGDAVCTSCHAPEGDPRFPTAWGDFDRPAHHFHEPESDGASCRTCHMIERVYMGVDGRRDHSFRIPRPDLTVAIGTPNACNDCHAARSAAWAAAEIAERFPEGGARRGHYGTLFAAARARPGEHEDALAALALDVTRPAIVRATALEYASRAPTPELAEQTAPLIEDPDPLVRASALAMQRGAPDPIRAARVLALVDDPVRSVRIAAARAALDLPIARLPSALSRSLGRAMGDWQASLANRADYPETHLVLGGTALVLRDLPSARASFREAVRLDPQLVDAWSVLVRLELAVGDRDAALRVVTEGLAAVDDPGLLVLRRQLETAP
ncbi:MAG: multiheme c-type cytochrome [Pseudomonadales bacterium]|jgi:predicted CXXCH cytochrome family protein|nr:multiheme c-type cytochrome [Pseudomonadales bacterium]